jgi:hypothetical protein
MYTPLPSDISYKKFDREIKKQQKWERKALIRAAFTRWERLKLWLWGIKI